MSRARRIRSLAAALIVTSVMAGWLATPARAGLILDLSLSPTGEVSSGFIQANHTYTIYLLGEIYYNVATPNNYINNLSMNLVSSTTSTWASGTGITSVQLNDGTNSTTNYFDAYHSSAPSSHGSATASPGLSSDNVGDWGSATKSANIFANAGTPTIAPYNGPTNGATLLPVGNTSNGFGVTGSDGSPGWAWVLGTATLTVGALPSGTGTLTYQAQIPLSTFPASTYKAGWFQNNAIIASTTPRNGTGTTWATASTGASTLEGVGSGVTFNLGSAPTISLDTPSGPLEIFAGATADSTTAMSVAVSNTGSAGSALNWNATLDSTAGGFSGTGKHTSDGPMAPGAPAINALYWVTSTTVGANALTWTIASSDLGVTNSPLSAGATLNVYAHGALSFAADGANATTTLPTLDFGNVLRRASGISRSFTIANWGPDGDTWTGLLDVTSDSSSPYTTNLPTLGVTDLHNTGTASSYNVLLNTATSGYYGATGSEQVIALTGQDAASLSSYPGYRSSAAQTLQLKLIGTVGWATAKSSNVASEFGTALTALVSGGSGSYAGLESTVVGVIGSAGAAHIATTATILAGINSGAATTVSQAWRTRLTDPGEAMVLTSDVVNLTGMSPDPYVLQMTGDPLTLAGFGRGAAAEMYARGILYLASHDTGVWTLAVASNFGNNASLAEQNFLGSFESFQSIYGTDLSQYIGAYGVDLSQVNPVDNTGVITAWAVVDHSGEFAVSPEPMTMAFLMFGGVAMVGAGMLRRRRPSA